MILLAVEGWIMIVLGIIAFIDLIYEANKKERIKKKEEADSVAEIVRRVNSEDYNPKTKSQQKFEVSLDESTDKRHEKMATVTVNVPVADIMNKINKARKDMAESPYPYIGHKDETGTYFSFKVQGIYYREDEEKDRAWGLKANEPVKLYREYENPRDKNAIVVASMDDVKIGYMSKYEARYVAPIFDSFVDAYVDSNMPDGDVPEVRIRAYFTKPSLICYEKQCYLLYDKDELKRKYPEFTDDILGAKSENDGKFLEFMKGMLSKYHDDFFIDYLYMTALQNMNEYEELLQFGEKVADKYGVRELEDIKIMLDNAERMIESAKYQAEYAKYEVIYKEGYALFKDKKYSEALDKLLPCMDSVYTVQALPRNICKCYEALHMDDELVSFVTNTLKCHWISETTTGILKKYLDKYSKS